MMSMIDKEEVEVVDAMREEGCRCRRCCNGR